MCKIPPLFIFTPYLLGRVLQFGFETARHLGIRSEMTLRWLSGEHQGYLQWHRERSAGGCPLLSSGGKK
jgi:hypothetical protein